jgi:hypothetical protein
LQKWFFYLVVGEDKKWILNSLPVALPKYESYILGNAVGDNIRSKASRQPGKGGENEGS